MLMSCELGIPFQSHHWFYVILFKHLFVLLMVWYITCNFRAHMHIPICNHLHLEVLSTPIASFIIDTTPFSLSHFIKAEQE